MRLDVIRVAARQRPLQIGSVDTLTLMLCNSVTMTQRLVRRMLLLLLWRVDESGASASCVRSAADW